MKLDRIRSARPSPAMAVAIAALFVALGGTAWAVATVGPQDIENDAVRSRHIKNGHVTSIDIRTATVRAADVADGSLTGAEIADAPSGNDDVNANRLDGKPAGAFASATSEPYHEVGAPGEPAFQNGWRNFNPDFASTAGFYKDSQGIVHLKGSLNNPANTSNEVAFILPEGYRPSKTLHLPLHVAVGENWGLTIDPDGSVTPRCIICNAGIDGLTFLAGAG